MQWRIVLNQEKENIEFHWIDFGEENLINFLNLTNDICKNNDSNLKWFPIASSYGSDFILTLKFIILLIVAHTFKALFLFCKR